jgi:hypothetical protein
LGWDRHLHFGFLHDRPHRTVDDLAAAGCCRRWPSPFGLRSQHPPYSPTASSRCPASRHRHRRKKRRGAPTISAFGLRTMEVRGRLRRQRCRLVSCPPESCRVCCSCESLQLCANSRLPAKAWNWSNRSALRSMQGDCAALLCWRAPHSATTFQLTWTRRPAHHPRHENRLPRSARRIDGK